MSAINYLPHGAPGYRPDLAKFATTNTKGTTGDGHKLAFAVGGAGVEMEHVQVRGPFDLAGRVDPTEQDDSATSRFPCPFDPAGRVDPMGRRRRGDGARAGV
eukprot:8605632-Pyramimonas_sp.AAC.1